MQRRCRRAASRGKALDYAAVVLFIFADIAEFSMASKVVPAAALSGAPGVSAWQSTASVKRRQRRPGLGEIGRGCAQRRYKRKRQRHERERAVVEPHGRRRRRWRLLHHVGHHEMVLASTAGPQKYSGLK
jgi:hypothetical protein